MGMLVFGQVILKEEEEELRGWWKKEDKDNEFEGGVDGLIQEAKTLNRFFDSIEDLFTRHGKALGEFIFRMHQRVKQSRREYLFELQAYIQESFAFVRDKYTERDNGKWNTTIVDIFKDLSKRFAVKQFLLFIPNLVHEINQKGEACSALRIRYISEKNEILSEQTNITINVMNIRESDRYVFNIDEMLPLISGFNVDEKKKRFVQYYGNQDKRHFFGVLIQWEEDWYDNVENNDIKNENNTQNEGTIHDGFFAGLISICRAIILTRVAWLKEKAIQTFSDISTHDIAQKAYIMKMFNSGFRWDIQNASDNNVFKSDKPNYREKAREEFKFNCESYNEQMRNCCMALAYLQRVLETGELKEEPEMDNFIPKERFLDNFNRQFNNPFHNTGQNRLCMQLPRAFKNMRADPVMVERALLNLLDNAFKFAYEDTNIYLEYSYDDYNHVFRVTNYCGGINEDMVNNIFIKGFRASINRPGRGLGLWAAKEYAIKHGGDCIFESGVQGDEKCLKARFNLSHLQSFENGVFNIFEDDIEDVNKLIKTMSEERERLKKWRPENIGKINPVAKYHYSCQTVYDELYARNTSFQKQREFYVAIPNTTITYDNVEIMIDNPTYAVTFKLIIPFNPSI
jgi:hypothetical protein